MIDGVNYYAHRLAWLYVTGAWSKIDVDHEDQCPSNNIFTNLREAAGAGNYYNRGKPRSNTSGFKGVSWCKRRNRWRAYITADRKRYALGTFKNIIDAAKAYDTKAVLLHGEFASRNFP